MPDHARDGVTKLLRAARDGGGKVQDRLFDLIYLELHKTAEALFRQERAGHTLQPSALVNEAFLKVWQTGGLKDAQSRKQLFVAFANGMRQILVDHARRRKTRKRGGELHRAPFDSMLDAVEKDNLDIVALDQALKELAKVHPRTSEVVTLRYFARLQVSEICDQLSISKSTVEADLRLARAWLHQKLTTE